jgi:hypothetical protein
MLFIDNGMAHKTTVFKHEIKEHNSYRVYLNFLERLQEQDLHIKRKKKILINICLETSGF